jgi:hypothetical protein
MMMLTFSSVSVSVNTFAAERFTSCRHIIAGQLNPSQQKNIFMANQSAHQLGHIKARSVGVEPTITALSAGSVIQTDFASTTLQARLDTCSTALLPVLRPYIAIGSR